VVTQPDRVDAQAESERAAGPGWLGRLRRRAGRAVSTLQFRATIVLAVLLAIQVGIAVPATRLETDTLDAMNRASLTDHVELDIEHVIVSMQGQEIGLTGYVQTGDPTFRDDFHFGQSQVAQTWPALVADARPLGLDGQLAPMKRALDAWSTWAVGQEEIVNARHGAAVDPASTRLGGALFDSFVSEAALYTRLVQARNRTEHAQARARARELLTISIRLIALSAGLTIVAAGFLAFALRPVTRLAGVAHQLAAGTPATVPYAKRRDEAGQLARALASYRDVEARQRAIFQRAPIGLLTAGGDGRVWESNPAFQQMLGYTAGELLGMPLESVTHPDDIAPMGTASNQVRSGTKAAVTMEKRYLRKDGSMFWAQLTIAPIRNEDGTPGYFIGMVDDITEHKEKQASVARVQRELLPRTSPHLPGYELVGACLTAEEVGGDFYDWLMEERGILTVTLGDVMGKGMPAALLMATMRSALRASGQLPTPARAVQSAADSLAENLEGAAAFITLFHARLEPRTGLLTYVDAGHGLGFVVCEDGRSRRLHATSPPLGALAGQRYREATVLLEPGEALVIFSDGVLEVDAAMVDASRVAELMHGADSAQIMADRLTAQAPAKQLIDDFTVLVLRRCPASVPAIGPGRS